MRLSLSCLKCLTTAQEAMLSLPLLVDESDVKYIARCATESKLDLEDLKAIYRVVRASEMF